MRKVSFGKRLISMVLVLVMLVGLMPAVTFAATDTVLDAAIFCSDVHGSSTVVPNVFSQIAADGIKPSVAGFVGDTNDSSSKQSASDVTTQAQAIFSNITCLYNYGSHDDEGGGGVTDVTGLLYGDTTTNFYVYSISQSSMSSSSADTSGFTSTVAALDKSKPLFIMSHMPLHSRRNDNKGAAKWYSAISAAAESMDIVFFWGHNHTGESSTDTAAYYVAKDGSETMSIQGGSTVTPNFTYMNAGYIGKSAGRGGYATTIQLYANKMVFQDYNSSGAVADNSYTHNVTVDFEFANLSKVTPTTLAVTGVVEYAVGDALRDPTKVVVTYSDGSTKELSASDLKLVITTEDGADLEDGKFVAAGTYNLTYSYTENNQSASATLEVVVKAGMSTVYSYANDPFEYYVQATALGLTGITATYVYEDYMDVLADTFTEAYMAYNVALEGHTDGNEVTYYFEYDTTIPLENLGLYYIDENNQLTAIPFKIVTEENIQYIEFTTTYVGVFAYGTVVVPDGYELSHITVDYEGAAKYLVGDTFDMVHVLVTAVYTKEGCDDFTCQLSIKGYGVEDGYEYTAPSMTAAGTKTITVTYGGKSASFDIEVYNNIFPDADTGVSVEVTVPGATEIKVETVSSTNGTVTGAVGHLLSNYVAYDIELTGYNDGEKVTVTLPVPEGVENPVVYYVSDDGKTVQNMGAAKNDDGTVSFETDHFSKYVVGESTDIVVPDPTTATVTGSVTTTEEKEVYVLVSSISGAGDYLIVNTNSATTSANLLTASSNGVTNTSGVTITTGTDANGNTVTYIEDPAAAAIWTAAVSGSGYTLRNTSSTNRYLRYSNSSFTTSSNNSTTWYSGTNTVYKTNSTRYIRYNNGWTTSSSSQTVYIYQKQTVNFATTTTVDGTYSIAGTPDEVTKVVAADGTTTVTLGSTLTFTPESGDATTTDTSTTATYTVVDGGDPNGIISGISGNTVTFSGNYGKALVKVSYTGTAAGKTYTVDNYIVVIASAPTYTLDITTGGNTVTGTTVSYKGITAGQTIALGTQIQFVDEEGAETVELPEGATLEWHIPEEYQSIATVDHDTGLVTLKGVDGAFYVTATLTVDGKDYTVGVNFSVTTTSYSTPTDGTADFPEYPNEGAVRFDKTATAVGNFSETGIAQIELSMTGVPYTTGSEIDVVLMLDMTGSMDDVTSNTSEPTGYVRIDATIAASKAFISTIVKNEDGSYNGNRVGVYVFNTNGAATLYDFGTVDSDTELDAIYADLNTIKDDHFASGGTPYDDGLAKCQEVLAAAKTDGIGNDRQQFTVFMTDGVPTSYAYVNGTSYGTHSSASAIAGMLTSSDNYATRDTDYKYEYYSTEMKKAGVTVYTVGIGLENENNAWSGSATQCLNLASALLNDISGPGGETTQPDAVGTSTHSKQDEYFFSVEDATAGTDMTKVFSNIAQKILQAATDIVVEDKITDEYTMIFDIPTGSQDITGVTNDFYIEFLKYTLDENHERTGTSTSMTKLYLKNTDGVLSAAKDSSGTAYDTPVFENKTIGEKGTLYFWTTDSSKSDSGISTTVGETTYYFVPYGIKATDEGFVADEWYNMTSGAYATGTINSETNMSQDLVIATPYFVYNAATRMLYWTVDKLDTEEYALRYFLYLDNSATEVGTDKEVDPGAYPTNEYAYLTYTNFNGNDCRQEMPVPQQTWSGAQVSYVFYLVNAAGQPINKSGQVVDFANATFITDIYTESTVWNKGEDGKITADSKLSIDWLAEELLPSDYMVYDLQAQYQLHVYGDHTGASIFDYFTIGGSTVAEISASLNSRLEGANTTASSVSATTTKVYNTKAGQKIAGYGTYTSEATTSIDNEVVLNGFDFYDTTVAFAVVWQPKLVEDTVVVDFGLDVLINVVGNDILQNKVTGIGLGNSAYGNIAMNTGVSTESKLGIADLTIDGHTIRIENETSIRFHQNNMTFTKPVVFYYESPVEFYEGSDWKEGYMYSKVTVIPATSIYYEDSFVSESDLKTYEWAGTDWSEPTIGIGTGDFSWKLDGSAENKTQSQDRPGTNNIAAVLDANNKYGYDAAYTGMSTHSMGSALKVHVDYDHMATASFSFYGTGFDLISMTSSTTGSIIVNVYDSTNAQVKSFVVNTYYGYKYENGEWVTTDSANPNALYQVPVIKVAGLDYGQYTAEIKVVYDPIFDQGLYGEPDENGIYNNSYDFYLDAIRIYDPTGNSNDTANDAYVADGEGWPLYKELRNLIVSANSFGSNITVESEGKSATTEVGGAVFIDGISGNTVIANYESFGPNNELYLAPGQSVAFQIADAFVNANGDKVNPVDVQLAVKSVYATGMLEIFNPGVKVTTTDDGNGTQTTTATATKDNLLKLTPGATDLYYSIQKLAGGTIVIANPADSGATISITNLKFTFGEKAEVAKETTVDTNGTTVEAEASVLSINEEAIVYAMRSLSGYSSSTFVHYETADPAPDATNPEDNTPEDNTPEDNTPEDNTPEDNTPEDNTPEDNTPEDNTPEDNTPEDNTPEDDNAEDETPEAEDSDKNEETESEAELGWFARILRAIGRFFRNLFGWIFN